MCPVYSRTGGQAYGSIYPGPIGAILTPQLRGLDQAPTLPWASSLCGACYEACPVRIDIPTVLVHLRGRVVREVEGKGRGEKAVMQAVARVFGSRRRYETAQKLARLGRGPLGGLGGGAPGLGAWTQARDLPEIPAQSFREWWASRERGDRTRRPGRRPATRPRRDRPGTRDMTAARDTVMRRIRDALGPAPAAPEAVPREYRQADGPVDFDPVERFAEVVADYDATVHRVAPRASRTRWAGAAASAEPRGSRCRPGCRGASPASRPSPTTRRSAPATSTRSTAS